jgi:hypothetical protein
MAVVVHDLLGRKRIVIQLGAVGLDPDAMNGTGDELNGGPLGLTETPNKRLGTDGQCHVREGR